MTISKEDVFAACRELEEQREKLTNRTVAAHLGAGGTENIRKNLKAYLEERDEFEQAPDGIRSVFLDAADRYWAQAIAEAAMRHEGERQELRRQAQEAEDEAAFLAKKLEGSCARERERTEEREKAGKAMRAAKSTVEELRTELGHVQRQLASEKSRADTLEKMTQSR